MSEAGKRLVESGQQALDFAKRTANAEEYGMHITEEIDVKKIRESLGMSQSEFAVYFGFSVRTLQDESQGVASRVARNFLVLLQREPEMARNVLVDWHIPSESSPSA